MIKYRRYESKEIKKIKRRSKKRDGKKEGINKEKRKIEVNKGSF